MSVWTQMVGASGAALGSRARVSGSWVAVSLMPFNIRTQLILSHILRNRVQTSFRPSPLP